jgi:5-methylcytosine-specific restriction endonuclease McrA
MSDDSVVQQLQDKLIDIHTTLDHLSDDSTYASDTERIDQLIDEMGELTDLERQLYAQTFGESDARGRIAAYLRANEHDPVTSQDISRVSGIDSHDRRLRELRNHHGFVIASTRTNAELSANEYVLVEVRDNESKRRIDSATRDEYISDNPFCEKCGFRPSEHNSENIDGNRYLEVDHIVPFEKFDDSEEANDESNLQTLCNVCHTDKGSSNDRWV